VAYLAEEFMRRFGRKHGVDVRGFSEDALKVLSRHNWPGNVRELQNVVERAVILCNESGVLEPEHLGMAKTSGEVSSTVQDGSAQTEQTSVGPDGSMPSLEEMEKRHILATLEHCKGNRTHAAKLLRVSIRTLRNKLHEYNGTQPGTESDESEITEEQGQISGQSSSR
jgi:DNA-binding NtrC family response regulator